MKAHWPMMARYNAWANARVHEAAERLSDADLRADRGAFFKSVLGTLNHLLVTDRIWMHRFTGTGEAPARLDVILFEHLPGLRGAHAAEADRIIAYVDTLTDEALAGTFRFRRVSTPDWYEQPLEAALAHLFNHQTHHRGQIHAILTGLEAEAPELDLLLYQRAAGGAARPVDGPSA